MITAYCTDRKYPMWNCLLSSPRRIVRNSGGS